MRHLRFVHVLIAVLMLVGGVALGAQEVLGNQQGPGIGDRATNMIGLCGMNGSTAEVDVDRVVDGVRSITVECIGGPLDGLWCNFTPTSTVCSWGDVGAAPTGPRQVEVDVPTLTFATEIADLTASTSLAEIEVIGSEPVLVEAAITHISSEEEMIGVTLIQVNGCRQLGGNERVGGPGLESSLASYTVFCEGGMLDGLWCQTSVGPSSCFFKPVSEAPATTIPMPTRAPQEPEATPTEAPSPTATVEPTPTDEPVIEPTFVDPTVEPTLPMFEPVTPTPIILT